MRKLVVVVTMAILPAVVQPAESSVDSALARRIQTKIDACVAYGVADYVEVEVQDGIVTLSGWSHSLWLLEKLPEIVGREPGVRSVVNNVQRSYGDESLVRRAANVIYSDALFYPHTLDLPVRIVVQNNRLILAGQVSSEAERNRAEFLVAFYTNAMSIDNQLVITQR